MTKLEELEAENTLMNKQLEQIEELGNENLNALLDRIKAHRSAPDVYDPPTFDQMADRILELEAKVAVAGKALNKLLNPPNGHPHIEAVTKEEWAGRAMNAEANKLAAAARIEELEDKLETCKHYRAMYAERDRIGIQAVRDLEANLAKVIETLEQR
jgi:DNA repair exonuclease SbcCD ATPase subunit